MSNDIETIIQEYGDDIEERPSRSVGTGSGSGSIVISLGVGVVDGLGSIVISLGVGVGVGGLGSGPGFLQRNLLTMSKPFAIVW